MYKNFETIPIYYTNKYSFIVPTKNNHTVRRFKLALIFTKAYEWQYEKEWRLFTFNNDKIGNPGFLAPFIVPKRVFLGCKIENRLKKDLLEICVQMKIAPYEMYMIPNTYKLKYRRIDIN